MGFYDSARRTSIERGLDYYDEKRVLSMEKTGENQYDGLVKGSGDNVYKVHIETDHPKKSKCNCPFADGKKIICKHMIAMYFNAMPSEAEECREEIERWYEEEYEDEEYYEDDNDYDEWEEKTAFERYEEINEYVYSLSKSELRAELLEALIRLDRIGYDMGI